MANERMVPLLPCESIDVIRDFYLPLGFAITYRQLKPNPYLALRREGIELHYFGMEGFRPEESYGSCLVIVEDTEPLFTAFASGLRATFGKVPLTGFPRITRPRKRANAGNLSGFSLIDPSGNWIRVMRRETTQSAGDDPPGGKLARVLANAVVLADSHGDAEQAAKILRGALSRLPPDTTTVDLVRSRAYLAELFVRLDNHEEATVLLDAIEEMTLSDVDGEAAGSAISQARELRACLDTRPAPDPPRQ